jgi:GNAT superfamily N-acetyltransferase
MLTPALLREDLSPGDREVGGRDFDDVEVRRVCSSGDRDFELAYDRLFAEFGPPGEMETRAVIEQRLAWDPQRPVAHAALAYELLVLRRNGEVAALRDHTAVVRLDAAGHPLEGPVVVHLSHALVEPAHRGSGLAAWLRALPLATARRCAAAAGLSGAAPIVLCAEMEPPDVMDAVRMTRLRSYERAGFRTIDRSCAPYMQPDFRAREQLTTSAPRAIPLGLVVRRVGREQESTIPAAEVAALVDAIYTMYGVHVPRAALQPLRDQVSVWTARQPFFRLLPPTQ